ncbi:hypothetical protein KJF94_16085 [Pseudomonas hormoni]|uniref:Uncharacterized protein n=1 Tax=Pseudomonas hormoni TaxID=3093767 RepID=A0ABX8EQ08_9PSED|nr:hypothetical protein [Pseudomonas hormoni]QVW21432.1 hypothetical protein KJF94_16085 [Pseudomonas hormoni]
MTIVKLYTFALTKLQAALLKSSKQADAKATALFKAAREANSAAAAQLRESNELAVKAEKLSALI